jgi:hypothetical protein
MLNVNYKGRFGNQMYIYTFARLIAEKFDYKFISNLPNSSILTPIHKTNGKTFENNKKITITDKFNIPGNYNGFPEYLEDASYYIDGYFHNIDYYKDNRDLIKSFFEYDKTNLNTNKEDIVLHIRLGDYCKLNWVVHPDYYLNILNKETFNNVYIITDEPTHSYLNYFKQYNPTIVSKSEKEDFYYLMSFDKMILSNSTFAYWAAFLSNPSTLYTFKRGVRYKQFALHEEHVNDAYNIPGCISINEQFLHER